MEEEQDEGPRDVGKKSNKNIQSVKVMKTYLTSLINKKFNKGFLSQIIKPTLLHTDFYQMCNVNIIFR